MYNNNFLSNSKTQEDHLNLAKKFSEVLPLFKLPYLKIDKNINKVPNKVDNIIVFLNSFKKINNIIKLKENVANAILSPDI